MHDERPVAGGGETIDVVQSDFTTGVPEPVRQHVVDGVCYFAHGSQDVHVEPLRKYLAVPAERAVQRLRNTDGEALYTPRKGSAIVRLRDEVEVVALHGHLDDAEVVSFARSLERGQDGAVALPATQALEPVDEAQRDVNGMVRRKLRAPQMRNGAWSIPRPPSAFARTPTPFVTKIESKLPVALH